MRISLTSPHVTPVIVFSFLGTICGAAAGYYFPGKYLVFLLGILSLAAWAIGLGTVARKTEPWIRTFSFVLFFLAAATIVLLLPG